MGLYNPHYNVWFSMAGHTSRKSSCPGTPNPTTGFHDSQAWFHCGEEVFRVYAEGRIDGETITDQDTLMFYVPCGKTYVSFRIDNVITNPCPSHKSGNQLPPNSDAFDFCGLETVEMKGTKVLTLGAGR